MKTKEALRFSRCKPSSWSAKPPSHIPPTPHTTLLTLRVTKPLRPRTSRLHSHPVHVLHHDALCTLTPCTNLPEAPHIFPGTGISSTPPKHCILRPPALLLTSTTLPRVLYPSPSPFSGAEHTVIPLTISQNHPRTVPLACKTLPQPAPHHANKDHEEGNSSATAPLVQRGRHSHPNCGRRGCAS